MLYKTVHVHDKIRSTSSLSNNTNAYIDIGSACTYKGHLNRTAFIESRVAQSVENRNSNLKVVGLSPIVGNIFNFVFCCIRRVPGRSTGPIQMKSTMTPILCIQVHRENDTSKEKWRRY